MNAQEWLSQLSEQPGAIRTNQILQALEGGLVVSDFAEVVSAAPDHEARFYVNLDALHVPLDDGSRFRFPVTAKLAQQIADILDLSLPTSKVMDLRHLNSNKLNATVLQAGPQMSSTSYSKTFNQRLEAKRNNQEGIISDIGKPWIIDNQLANSQGATLYGFYDSKAPFTNSIGLKMWQLISTRHNNSHTDYAATCLLMKNSCLLDGTETTIQDLAKHPTYSKLLNYSGPLKFLRTP